MKKLCDIPFSLLSREANAIIAFWLEGFGSFEDLLALELNGAELQQELLQTGAFWLENGVLCVKLFDDESEVLS